MLKYLNVLAICCLLCVILILVYAKSRSTKSKEAKTPQRTKSVPPRIDFSALKDKLENNKLFKKEYTEQVVKITEDIFGFVKNDEEVVRGVLIDAINVNNDRESELYYKNEEFIKINGGHDQYTNIASPPCCSNFFVAKPNCGRFIRFLDEFVDFINGKGCDKRFKRVFNDAESYLVFGSCDEPLKYLTVVSLIVDLKKKSSILPSNYGTHKDSNVQLEFYINNILNAVYLLATKFDTVLKGLD